MSRSPSLRKRLRWRIEYGSARSLFGLLGLLPVDWSSAVGAALMRRIGPLLRAHKVARQNLQRIFPDKSGAEIRQLLDGMWDNLGRTIGELPHLDEIAAPDSGRIVVRNSEQILTLKSDDQAGILFSAHLANWELGVTISNVRFGMPVHPMFRAPNNPLMEDLYHRLRQGSGGETLAKGRHGARRALALLARGDHLAMLVDQKMNDGIEVPFMGHPAMTAPAMASFALKFGIPMVPVQVIRTHGVHFELRVEDPLPVPTDLPRKQAIEQIMKTVNDTIGRWIEENPSQWLWVHRRWKEQS